MTDSRPPICDYEGSDYQESFWERGGRAYEDAAEAIALRALLPASGKLALDLGAGAGRNAPRLHMYERLVLADYSLTQMQQARARLGDAPRYVYVAANAYRLPFRTSVFDGVTMIRVLHHIVEPQKVLAQIRRVTRPQGTFILEFANKLNLKAIARYWLGRQQWSPFTPEAVEFVPLNFDFHPRTVRSWLTEAGFTVERQRTVSHFRIALLKRLVPARLLASLDGLAQLTGDWWQLTPSVFVRSKAAGAAMDDPANPQAILMCPDCQGDLPEAGPGQTQLVCGGCGHVWPVVDGIYDFRGA